MFANSLLRKILIPKKQPRLIINNDMLKKILLKKKQNLLNKTNIQSQSQSFMKQEVKVYNSNTGIPKFFNLKKRINGEYVHIIGKRLENNKYIIKIIKQVNGLSTVRLIQVDKKKVQQILDGNCNNMLHTKKKTLTKKKSIIKKKTSTKKKKPIIKKKSSTKKKPIIKKKSSTKKKPSTKKKKSKIKK
jgi:hypothetical protein